MNEFDTFSDGRYHRPVRFFVHSPMSPSVAPALVRHEHQACPLPLPETDPQSVLEAAKTAQLDIVTADAALAHAAVSGEAVFNRSVIYLAVEPGEVEQDDAIDRLFARYKRLTPGRLYTVTAGRVKVRQLPTTIHS